MNLKDKEFTPLEAQISLHGLGFIQVVLPNDTRMHVWHPDLPRRDCCEHSAIHNHRFAFTSCVLKGVQKNIRVDIELTDTDGSHVVISHNGPRSDKGGRLSKPVAHCNIIERQLEKYFPGDNYYMPMLEYHYTPCEGIVVTLMQKRNIGYIHANTIIQKGHNFHYDFDRFQLPPKRLWEFVMEALAS